MLAVIFTAVVEASSKPGRNPKRNVKKGKPKRVKKNGNKISTHALDLLQKRREKINGINQNIIQNNQVPTKKGKRGKRKIIPKNSGNKAKPKKTVKKKNEKKNIEKKIPKTKQSCTDKEVKKARKNIRKHKPKQKRKPKTRTEKNKNENRKKRHRGY